MERFRFRFDAEPNTLVNIFNAGEADTTPRYVGLTLNESHTGFCGLFVTKDIFYVGNHYESVVGVLPQMTCEVRWSKRLAEHIVQVGFEYVEEDED